MAKQLIRGPKTAVLVPRNQRNEGLPLHDAVTLSRKEGRVMVSDRRLVDKISPREFDRDIRDADPCWTGDVFAHPSVGKTFREDSEHDGEYGQVITRLDKDGKRWVFPIPLEHLDKIDCLIVAQSQNYELVERGDDIIVVASKVEVQDKFPRHTGSYSLNECLGIPQDTEGRSLEYELPAGEALSEIPYRSMCPEGLVGYSIVRFHGKTVGAIARSETDFHSNYVKPRILHLDRDPTTKLGVIVEATEDDILNRNPVLTVTKDGFIVEGKPSTLDSIQSLMVAWKEVVLEDDGVKPLLTRESRSRFTVKGPQEGIEKALGTARFYESDWNLTIREQSDST